MPHSDYNAFKRFYQDKSTNTILTAAATTQTDVVAPKSANHRIYIQRIVVAPTTWSDKTWTFQDDAGTPVPIAHIDFGAAAPVDGIGIPLDFDFGPAGIPLTLGKNLDINISAAGVAAAVHIEAYQKLEGAVAAAPTN